MWTAGGSLKIYALRNDAGGLQQMAQTYTYDTLNRLTGAGENVTNLPAGVTPGNWSANFTPDRYGNLWGANTLGMTFSMPATQDQLDASTNRLLKRSGGDLLPADAYDSAGNLRENRGH